MEHTIMTDIQQQMADVAGMQSAEMVHRNGALSPEQIQQQYDLIKQRDARLSVPVNNMAGQPEPVGKVDPAQVIRGGAMLVAVAGGLSIAVVTITQICAAAVAFIQAYSMPIGGGAVAVLILFFIASSRNGGNGGGPKSESNTGEPVTVNQTVIINQH